MNGVHVICPCCGTEIEIGDNTTTVKGSGQLPDGIYTLIPKNDKKLKALADLGFDTSKFFNGFGGTGSGSSSFSRSSGFSGSSASADRPEDYDDCTPDPQADEDAIQQEIMSDGYIEGKNLFRRWVMAQMFRALESGDYQKYYRENYNYLYQWKVVVDEFKAQSHITDMEELRIRQTFFNWTVLYNMLQDYRKKFLSFTKNSKKFGEKDNKYIFVPYNANYYLSEVPTTLNEIDTLLEHVKNTGTSVLPTTQGDPAQLYNYASQIYKLIKGFNNSWPRLKNNTPKAPAFREAFMAAGAYYTLENMIKFHGCYIYVNDYINEYLNTSFDTDDVLSQDLSLEVLKQFKKKYNCYTSYYRAYDIFKLMLDTIEKNKFQEDW